jgi:acyl-CoA dehydrogenase
MGPSNFLGAAYMQMPVSITVEGANILTRSLIVFGQGAIRCHPYVLREMAATQEADRAKALRDFDAALAGHLRFGARNTLRTFGMALTASAFVRGPKDVASETRRYYRQLTRLSAALAFLADVSMGTLGGALKRKEKLSARLGDVLSLLYLCSATLWRYEHEGRQAADAPLMHWAIRDALFKAQNAIEGAITNFPNRFLAAFMRFIVFPRGRPHVVPSDRLGQHVARLVIEPSAARDRLTAGMFIGDPGQPVGLLERALAVCVVAEPIERKLRSAVRSGRLAIRAAPGEGAAEIAAQAVAAGVISDSESAVLASQRDLVARVVGVDDFAQDLGASLLQPSEQEPSASARPHGAPLAHRAVA